MLDRHPWIALLGWIPPVWVIGAIRAIGNDDYEIGYGSWIGGSVNSFLWWPLNLYNRKRREKKRRMQ